MIAFSLGVMAGADEANDGGIFELIIPTKQLQGLAASRRRVGNDHLQLEHRVSKHQASPREVAFKLPMTATCNHPIVTRFS